MEYCVSLLTKVFTKRSPWIIVDCVKWQNRKVAYMLPSRSHLSPLLLDFLGNKRVRWLLNQQGKGQFAYSNTRLPCPTPRWTWRTTIITNKRRRISLTAIETCECLQTKRCQQNMDSLLIFSSDNYLYYVLKGFSAQWTGRKSNGQYPNKG